MGSGRSRVPTAQTPLLCRMPEAGAGFGSSAVLKLWLQGPSRILAAPHHPAMQTASVQVNYAFEGALVASCGRRRRGGYLQGAAQHVGGWQGWGSSLGGPPEVDGQGGGVAVHLVPPALWDEQRIPCLPRTQPVRPCRVVREQGLWSRSHYPAAGPPQGSSA